MKLSKIDNGWTAFALWSFATVLVAILGSSLTWDGSYYLWKTLHHGHALIAHHRYANFLLLEPVVWLAKLGAPIRVTAALHGLLCGMTGIVCFLAILRMTVRHPRERVWLLAGVVLSPLPGMIDATMEITPAMQTAFLAVAAAWFLPMRLALPVCGLAGLWMCLLHPIAAPLLGFAACAVLAGDWKRWPCAFLLGGISVTRALLVWLAATAYERGQFDQNLIWSELQHMRASTPWWLVLEGAAVLLIASTGKLSRRNEWIIWLGLAIYVAWWMSEPMRWSGALNYRKFAGLFVLPFLIPAAFARRSNKEGPTGSILGMTTIGCTAWISAAISWHLLLGQFQQQIRQAPGPFVRETDGVSCVKHNALAHWGATPLSLLLLEENRVFVADGVTVRNGKLVLFETEELPTRVMP